VQKIKKIVSSSRDYLVLAVVIAASVFLMFFMNDTSEIGGLQAMTLEMFGQLARPMSALRQWQHVYEENHRLRMQNAMLQIRNSQLAEAHYENIRLRQMVGFATTTDLPLKPAHVIGIGARALAASIVLDIGYSQGVRENMPVVSADGLVGKVLTVSTSHCVVQLLIDSNFRVAALVQRSRVQGKFQWSGYDSGTLESVNLSADIQEGDVVVTSGLNSIFPPGLKIGVISDVDAAHAGLFQKIYVKPRISFNRLEEVFVIMQSSAAKSGE
jgi:rod shape-determining protein MreC